ncbi:MAG: hypothetical protein ABW092_14425 [Candidatus Thiodiazotropha sp.]
MKWLFLTIVIFISGYLIYFTTPHQAESRLASEWNSESWQQPDGFLAKEIPSRLLAITDLPPLDPVPRPEDFVAAVRKSTLAGCDAAVLTISWPALEPQQGQFTFDQLKEALELQKGRFLFLGIQVVNTTVKEFPFDLQEKPFDDPDVLKRFHLLLDAIAPLLKNRIRFLSIGNETDVYLSIYPDETEAYATFLNAARRHAKSIAPDLIVSTTVTEAGALQSDIRELVRHMDAHFLTYYHGQHGMKGTFKNPRSATKDILAIATRLDDRPIVFQEIGFPAHESLGSPEKQAIFVNGVFDAWAELGSRVPMINYFMMYDFPKTFVTEQLSYYGVSDETERLSNFVGSLGLHESDGTPRAAWKVFVRRGTEAR